MERQVIATLYLTGYKSKLINETEGQRTTWVFAIAGLDGRAMGGKLSRPEIG